MSSLLARWVRLFASAAPALVLSSCGGQGAGPAEQCYRSSDQGATWTAFPDAQDVETCFSLDRCLDGAAKDEFCTKWANDANAPARSWVDLGFGPFAPASSPVAAAPGPDLPNSALLTNPQPIEDIPPPPYAVEVSTDCRNGACVPHRLVADTPILSQPSMTASIVGTIPAAECVQPGDSQFFPQRPQRGVVLEATPPFAVGDVIYVPGYADGDYTIWWRGSWHTGIYSPLDVVVRWDRQADDPRTGRWVHYTRANGQTGWARNPETRDEKCG